MSYMKEHKKLILVILIFLVSTSIFIGIYYKTKSCIKEPNEKDFKTITMNQLNSQLKGTKIDTIYYAENNNSIYIITKDNKLETILNPRTDEFKDNIFDANVKIEPLTNLKFKSVILANKMFIFGFILSGIYIWCIYYLMKDSTLETNDNITVVNKKKKKLVKEGGTNSTANTNIDKNYDDTYKTFDDIAGLKEVKKDMKCLVDFLVNKERYLNAGAKLPKGVILYGPPGTGKTLLAKAVANEANVPFLYMSGSEFIEMYVGVGAKRVRELFEKARKNSPCIIFIDEIDAIGSKRTDNDNGEDRKTINALLTEMDGFKETDNIIVIGATNRIDDLDTALLRPGRFTDKFCVPLPETSEERLEVLNVYAKNKNFDESVDLKGLAKETVGFSPAKLEALLNDSAIIAVQNDRLYITKSDIDNAMFKLLLSGHIKEGQDKRGKKELELVAWHEAGHALVGCIYGKEVTKVTILASTSGAGGVTFSTPKTGLLSRNDIKHEIMQLYGGRVGELIYFKGNEDNVTTGASNDINEATKLIHAYVTDYAMNKEIGMINLGNDSSSNTFLREKEIEMAKELETSTISLLNKYEVQLKELAELLLEKETIYESDIKAILDC